MAVAEDRGVEETKRRVRERQPRFLALFTMLPLLTIYADIIGIFGGYMVSVYKLGLSHALYIKMTFDPLALKDIFTGLFKTMIFASIISIIA